MKIYTAYFKYSSEDYYTEHNRKMFLNREDADAFLTDLMNYEHIERYYVLEEEVYEEFSPTEIDDEDDEDYPCDIINEF